MDSDYRIPRFGLGVVVQETGIQPDTLRAWERRYQLPAPNRTGGGHRLYSRYDIDLLKWLLERQNEGMRISQAANLWKQLEEKGENPLLHRPLSVQPVSGEGKDFSLPLFQKNWVDACLDFDESAAEKLLAQAFAIFPIETVVREVLLNGLNQIGMLWFRGLASVQQEHFASNLAIRKVDSLFSALPAVDSGKTILVACPPEENHHFSSLFLAYLLRQRGFRVVYLGANVALERLTQTLKQVHPDLVVMPAMHLVSAAHLRSASLLLHDNGYPLGFGGRIFNHTPSIRHRIWGHFLGEKLEQAISSIDLIVNYTLKTPEVEMPSTDYITASQEFERRKSHLMALTFEYLSRTEYAGLRWSGFFEFFTQVVQASLNLGSLDFLIPEFHSMEEWGTFHEMPAGWFQALLDSFHKAVTETKNPSFSILEDWFHPENRKLTVSLSNGGAL